MVNFLSLKKIIARLNRRIVFKSMYFFVKMVLFMLVHVSDETFDKRMDILLITDESKFHYVYIKDFDRFVCNNTKNKKHFCRCCLQCFSCEKILQEDRKVCLKINGKQSVKLRSGSIKFKNYFK